VRVVALTLVALLTCQPVLARTNSGAGDGTQDGTVRVIERIRYAVATNIDGQIELAEEEPTATATPVRPTPTLANSHAEPGNNGCQTSPPSTGGVWPILGLLLLSLRRRYR